MASCLQRIASGNESRAEGENDEMNIPNYRERSRLNKIKNETFFKIADSTSTKKFQKKFHIIFLKCILLFTFENSFIQMQSTTGVFWVFSVFYNKNAILFFLIKSFRLRLKIQRKAYKYIEKRLLHRFFLENFQKFCKAAVLKNISEWLLLIYVQGITFI